MTMPRCYVSIGSNIDAERNVASSIRAMEERFGDCEASPLYRTPAEGFAGDDFVNAVVAFDSDLDPATIHRELRRIEDEHGRVRGAEKFAPRTLDLDLLLHGESVGDFGGCSLPRDEIEHYAFVLKPLHDLCPDCRYPLTGERISLLWQRMQETLPEGQLQPL